MPEHTGISDDLDVLLAALQPAHGKRLVTISSYGAGEAAITLAANDAENVFSYDIEDAGMLRQLISFKVAAGNKLAHREYLALMGLRPSTKAERFKLFAEVLDSLVGEDRKAWRERRHWIGKGLYYSNQQTFFLQILWGIIWLLTSKRIRDDMFFNDSAEERSRCFRRYVARPWLVYFFKLFGSRINFFYPESEWKNSEYPKVYNRNPFPYFEHLINGGLAGNPAFAQYFQDETIGMPNDLLPPHMRVDGYSGFKNIGNRIKIMQSKPKQVPSIELDDRSCHGAYLSNIIDYLNHEGRALLCKEIVRVLKPGSPVLVYSSESFDKVPADCGLELDASTSERLKALDRVRTYSRVCLYRTKV